MNITCHEHAAFNDDSGQRLERLSAVAKHMLERAQAGDPGGSLLAVLSTDPAAEVDVPAWARLRGATYLGHDDPPDGGEGRAHLVRTAAPARTLGVNHVGVSVSDLDAARGFWVEQLGFVEVGGWTWPVGTAPSDAALDLEGTSASVALLRAGSMHLELFEFHAPAPAPRDPSAAVAAGLGHVALAVTDVAAVTARLGAAGAPVLAEPGAGEGAAGAAWVADPDGNLVELVTAAPGRGYGLGGLEVRAHPPAGPDDPAPTAPRRDDVLGVHHVAIGVAGAPGSGAARWATYADARAGTAQPWPPRDLPGAVTGARALDAGCRAGVLLDAGNVRLEVVAADDVPPRGICDLGYNHVCLDVEGIDAWPERLALGQVRWHHDVVQSSGGIAAVRYGREEGGVVIELLENRSSQAMLWCGHLPGLTPR